MFFDGKEAATQKLEEFLATTFQLGLVCSAELPRKRKNMREVASELNAIREQILCGKLETASSSKNLTDEKLSAAY
ncbi:hypothetical protein MLD38_009827 [Melastoma candidum]|nr:hypothetical protein MLD38_009827 [Melastoma candidum]